MPNALVTSPINVFVILTISSAAVVVTLPKTSVMNDSRSPSSRLPEVLPVLPPAPAAAVAVGVKSEPTELKKDEIADIPGRLSCRASMTGVGALDSSGRTARAVTEAALSTLMAFCRTVEVFN